MARAVAYVPRIERMQMELLKAPLPRWATNPICELQAGPGLPPSSSLAPLSTLGMLHRRPATALRSLRLTSK